MPAPWASIAEGRIVGRLHGVETVNVFHFGTNTVVNDPPQLDQLLLQIAAALLECTRDTLLPAVTSDWTLVQCDAQRLYPALSDPVIDTGLPADVGALGPTSVSFAASLLNLRTGIDGRRGRGRKFLPPPGEPQVAQSDIDGPTLALIAAFAVCLGSKFIGNNPATDWRLGILSRADLEEIGGTFDNSFRQVVSINPVVRLAVLRSRKVGRGS